MFILFVSVISSVWSISIWLSVSLYDLNSVPEGFRARSGGDSGTLDTVQITASEDNDRSGEGAAVLSGNIYLFNWFKSVGGIKCNFNKAIRLLARL